MYLVFITVTNFNRKNRSVIFVNIQAFGLSITSVMRFRKVLIWVFGILFILGVLFYSASKICLWPSVLLIRYAFEYGADRKSEALEKHLP